MNVSSSITRGRMEESRYGAIIFAVLFAACILLLLQH
jgi:hypothetical protein